MSCPAVLGLAINLCDGPEKVQACLRISKCLQRIVRMRTMQGAEDFSRCIAKQHLEGAAGPEARFPQLIVHVVEANDLVESGARIEWAP